MCNMLSEKDGRADTLLVVLKDEVVREGIGYGGMAWR
jgi:hypothetical protein